MLIFHDRLVALLQNARRNFGVQVEVFAKAVVPYEKNYGSSLATKTLAGTIATYDDIKKMDESIDEETKVKRILLQERLGSFVTAKGNNPRAQGEPEEWYAEVICFVRITPPRQSEMQACEVTFVRWYQSVKMSEIHKKIGLPRLKLEKTTRPNDQNQVKTEPYTDLSFTTDLLEPVFLQKDPSTDRKWYFHNKYVR